ncbi:MAG: general secretion pathway protein GspB [Gammaproteobacteria bacterium]|jgi:general secretion pathway protein B
MSYILEALKKADQERSIGEVPDLEAAHWGVRRRERSYRWLWVVAALLAVNGILIAVLLGRDVPESVPVAGNQGAAVETEPARAPVPETGMVEAPAPLRRRVPPEARPRTPEPVASVSQAAPAGSAAARPSPARSRPQGSAVPGWDELSLEFRSTFTPPRLDVHVYADEPARRFILVDLKKYREGDTLQSGAVLEKILPGSVQLNYQGTRFRLDK